MVKQSSATARAKMMENKTLHKPVILVSALKSLDMSHVFKRNQ